MLTKPVSNLKFRNMFSMASLATLRRSKHVFRQAGFHSGHGLSSHTHFPPLCPALPWQLQGQKIQVPRSILIYVFCSAYLSRKPQRHCGLFACTTEQIIPYGLSQPDFSKHLIQRQQKARLANLCRLCTSTDKYRSSTLHQRRFWNRIATNRLCSGCHYHRSELVSIPMGDVPPEQGSHQAAYVIRSKRQYSDIHSYQRRQTARCKRTRRADTGAGLFLHNGPGIFRLRTALCSQSVCLLFYHQGQIKFAVSKTLLSPHRQINGSQMRSNRSLNRLLFIQRLSGKNKTDQILRFRNKKDLCVFDQQFYSITTYRRRSLSMQVASGAVFQMDQTKSTDKIILRDYSERCKNSNLDSSFGICSCSNYQKAA